MAGRVQRGKDEEWTLLLLKFNDLWDSFEQRESVVLILNLGEKFGQNSEVHSGIGEDLQQLDELI